MAHPLNDLINRAGGKKATPCNSTCRFFKFPHLPTACELSSVFSVPQGVPCFEYQPEKTKDEHEAEKAIRRDLAEAQIKNDDDPRRIGDAWK
jgi:hypothetical protein